MNWRAALLAACLAVPTGLWAQDVSPAEAAASALEDLSAARDLLEGRRVGASASQL